MKFVFALILSAVSGTAFCQVNSYDSLFNSVAERLKEINKSKMSMPGYRVQLYFGSERIRANQLKADFLQEYPDVGAYVIYHQPNFKLRVGDFKTRLEAKKFLDEVQTRFAVAFIVSDDVKLPLVETK
jgi:hypothetical protein